MINKLSFLTETSFFPENFTSTFLSKKKLNYSDEEFLDKEKDKEINEQKNLSSKSTEYELKHFISLKEKDNLNLTDQKNENFETKSIKKKLNFFLNDSSDENDDYCVGDDNEIYKEKKLLNRNFIKNNNNINKEKIFGEPLVRKKLDFNFFFDKEINSNSDEEDKVNNENAYNSFIIPRNSNLSDINDNNYVIKGDNIISLLESKNSKSKNKSKTQKKQKTKYWLIKKKRKSLQSTSSSSSFASCSCSNSNSNSNLYISSSDEVFLPISKFDEEFIILKTISKGEMGTVYLCRKLCDKKIYVVKETNFFSRKIDYFNTQNLIKDIENNKGKIGYEFIHKYIDFWIEKKNFNEEENLSFFKNNSKSRNMYIVSDYCINGNLKEFINEVKNNKKFEEEKFLWDILFEMLISLNFLHKLGYIHLDIKPSNYFVNKEGKLLLSDFCLTIKENEFKNFSFSGYEYEGDSIYISPELFYKDYENINHKSDIFSLGLSFLEIITDYELPKNGEVWQKIRNDVIPLGLWESLGDVKNNFKKLILAMTHKYSKERPEIEDILKDKENYPELYERYKLIEEGKYSHSFDINNIKIKKIGNYENIFENNIRSRKSSNNFSTNANGNIDFNLAGIFCKRSDSMKSVKKLIGLNE